MNTKTEEGPEGRVSRLRTLDAIVNDLSSDPSVHICQLLPTATAAPGYLMPPLGHPRALAVTW